MLACLFGVGCFIIVLILTYFSAACPFDGVLDVILVKYNVKCNHESIFRNNQLAKIY